MGDTRAVIGTWSFPRRRWFVGYVLGATGLTLTTMGAQSVDAEQVEIGNMRPCWTFRSAQRLARRWNRRNFSPGLFEVFGPLGKEEG